jgi:hypothetical protein
LGVDGVAVALHFIWRVFVHSSWLLAFMGLFCPLLENGIIGFGHHGTATLGASSMLVMMSEVYWQI